MGAMQLTRLRHSGADAPPVNPRDMTFSAGGGCFISCEAADDDTTVLVGMSRESAQATLSRPLAERCAHAHYRSDWIG